MWYTERDDFHGLAAAGGSIWVSDKASGRVASNRDDISDSWKQIQVDQPEDIESRLTEGFASRPLTGMITVIGQTLWVANLTSTRLATVDTNDQAVVHVEVPGATGGATGMAAIGDDLWVTFHGGQIARVLGREGHPATVRSVVSPAGIAGDETAVWVASEDDHAVIRLDPTSLDGVARIDVGGKASGVAVGPDGSVWVTIR